VKPTSCRSQYKTTEYSVHHEQEPTEVDRPFRVVEEVKTFFANSLGVTQAQHADGRKDSTILVLSSGHDVCLLKLLEFQKLIREEEVLFMYTIT